MKSIKIDEFANECHDAFLEAFNSKNNLADAGALNAYVEIITSYLDKKRMEFDIPPKSYLVHLLNKHSDKIFVSGQSFSEWSTNFQNLLEI